MGNLTKNNSFTGGLERGGVEIDGQPRSIGEISVDAWTVFREFATEW